MDDVLGVTLSCNTGLILEYQGTKLLLDGIYGTKGHPFSSPGQIRWKKMLSGTAPYDKIDYLLFSHQHPDHFTPSMALDYLKAQRVKGISFPVVASESQTELISYIEKTHFPCLPLSPQTQPTTIRSGPSTQKRSASILSPFRKMTACKCGPLWKKTYWHGRGIDKKPLSSAMSFSA